MREIKFRAWDTYAETMIGVETLDFNDEGIACFIDFDGISLDRSECQVMQYTGLKDKNGVETYEGDIVKIQVNDRLDWNTIKGKVVFLEGAWLVEDAGKFAIELWSEMNEIEIIGNIYENPELLETKKTDAPKQSVKDKHITSIIT